MTSEMFTAFIPCRAGSKRIPRKNTREFTPDGESLLAVKLEQLSKLTFVDEIVVSTDDPVCVEIAKAKLGSSVTIDRRSAELAQDSTPLADLIEHFGSIARGEKFLWTHVTSPFFSVKHYERAYEMYVNRDSRTQVSLMAVEKIRDFLWFRGQPLNFGVADDFWPPSQNLEPTFRVTSSLFLGPTDLLRNVKNRICSNPQLFEVHGHAAIDIDWEFQFSEATELLRHDPLLIK